MPRGATAGTNEGDVLGTQASRLMSRPRSVSATFTLPVRFAIRSRVVWLIGSLLLSTKRRVLDTFFA
jgi:hypothetical protein